MDALTAIFGDKTKVKILRLFMFNPETPFFVAEVSSRTQSLPRLANRELNVLESAGIILKRRHITKDEINSGKKAGTHRVKGVGYVLNPKFPYLDALKNLLSISSVQADQALAKRFVGTGRLKLMMAAGVFTQDWNSRVDLLLVGDGLNIHRIESVIKGLEAEVGKEIAYSVFPTQDFEYRMGIHDRLVRDILDYPHITLIDRLGVEAH